MTDDQLADFLGIAKDDPLRANIGKMDPAKRAAFEAMAAQVKEIQLYAAGLAPKPHGVIVCQGRGRHRA